MTKEIELMDGGGCACGCCGPVEATPEQEREALLRQKKELEERLSQLAEQR